MSVTINDYMKLFRRYKSELAGFDLDSNHARYDPIFEQVIDLLTENSRFNRSLPETFTLSATQYREKHPGALEYLGKAVNRHYMLCDVVDYITMLESQERMTTIAFMKQAMQPAWSRLRSKN